MREAFQLARSMGLDVFVIQEKVVKIYDRQKLQEQQAKRNRQPKEKFGIRDIVEVKLRLNVDEDGYQNALGKAHEALLKGDKVKLLMILRGREIVHSENAFAIMQRLIDELSQCANVSRCPRFEGKSIIAILEPLALKDRHGSTTIDKAVDSP